jgi:hypothetical protein
MRASCYLSLAWDLHDPEFCDQVIPVKIHR